MKSAIEYIQEANEVIILLQKAGDIVHNSISLLDNNLQKTRFAILEMDNILLNFNSNLKVLNTENIAGENVGEAEPGSDKNGINSNNADDTGKENRMNSALNAMDGIHEFIEHTEKIANALGHIYPNMGKLKEGVGIISSFSGETIGVAKLVSAPQRDDSLAECLVSAAEIIAGISNIAESTVCLAPMGLVIAGGAMFAGAIASNYVKEEEQEQRRLSIRKREQRSLSTFSMSEKDADNYISKTNAINVNNLHPWAVSNSPVKDNLKKYGKNAYDLNIPLPYQRTDHLTTKPNIPPGIQYTKEDEAPIKKSYLEETFDLQQRIRYEALTNGRKALDKTIFENLLNAKEYDSIHHTNTLRVTKSAINESLTSVLHSANDGTATFDTDMRRSLEYAKRPRSISGNSNARAITINLNKPMIGNFIINTRDARDGLADFKHEVEEILLEILNSANVIQ